MYKSLNGFFVALGNVEMAWIAFLNFWNANIALGKEYFFASCLHEKRET